MRRWYEIDYSWYSYEDLLVYRPTEQAAFEHLDCLARLFRASNQRTDLSEQEWLVLTKDLELRRKNVNANITPVDIALRLSGYTPQQVESTLRQISVVMALREELGLPALPVMPAQFKRIVRRLERVA